MNAKVDSKVRILIAAKSEFAERGFSGARMEVIAKMAGLNKAMLHYYFGSKEKLYKKVLKCIFEVTEIRFREVFKDIGEIPPGQKLHFFLRFMVSYNQTCSDPEFNRILVWEMAEKKDYIRPLSDQYFLPRVRTFEKLIQDGVDAGIFFSTNPLLDVMHFISFFHFTSMQRYMAQGTQLHQLFYAEAMAEEWARHTIAFFFRAVAKDPENLQIPPLSNEQERLLQRILSELQEKSNNNYEYFVSILTIDEEDKNDN